MMIRSDSRRQARITLLGILAVALVGAAGAQECAVNGEGPEAGSDGYYEHKNVFWGDLHVHTSWSFDAVTIGTRTTPEDAYAFAKGAEIGLPPYDMVNGVPVPTRRVSLSRPLDFLAVTDHSEYLGEVRMCAPCLPGEASCTYGAPPDYEDSLACKALQVSIPVPGQETPAQCDSGGGSELDPTCLQHLGFALWGLNILRPNPERFPFCLVPPPPENEVDTWGPVCKPPTSDVWAEYIRAAENNYDPCHFTSLVGYEWTAMPQGKNHHRNVIFANADVPSRPVSIFETHGPDPTALWARLDADCVNSTTLDCDAIAIPHNSNIGGGNILPVTSPGSIERRNQIRYESLIEIHQTKGNSECRRGVGTNDENCQFELMTKELLFGPAAYAGPLTPDGQTLLTAEQQGYVADPATGGTYNNFVREFLKAGLYLGARSGGANPYKLGIVGATDTHGSTAGMVDEVDYEGQHGLEDDTRTKRLSGGPVAAEQKPDHSILEANPGAVTAVWATENTRAAIFSGLKTKETYGTSGIRPVVRFFGGWSYDPATMCSGTFEEIGYTAGVPMGSTLRPRPAGSTSGPFFAIKVSKDPAVDPKTKIERVQVTKGWIEGQGQPKEKVFTVMGPEASPKHSPYVDPDTCALSDGGGKDEVCLVWEDPSFQADQAAFYYVRVLQTPTCRWSTLQCNEYPTQAERDACLSWISQPALKESLNDNGELELASGVVVERTIQERAWTSPIWYDPPAQR